MSSPHVQPVDPAPSEKPDAAHPEQYTFDLAAADDWPCAIRLNQDGPNALVVGPAGSGKTNVLQIFAGQALAAGWHLTVADPRRYDWSHWSDHHGVTVVSDIAALLTALDAVNAEMTRRRDLLTAHHAASVRDLPTGSAVAPHLLVIDDLEVFTIPELGDSSDARAGNEQREQVTSRLETILREGRALGVHALVAQNRPDSSPLPRTADANLGVRISCGTLSRPAWLQMFGGGASPVQEASTGVVHLQIGPHVPVVPVDVPCVL